jgi:hypothetical protein
MLTKPNNNMTREQYIEEKLGEEFTAIDTEEETKDMLDETYSFKKLGGPFQYMSAGEVLAHYDHTSFREELNNYIDFKVRDGDWIEYQQGLWPRDAYSAISSYNEALEHCDPFHVADGEHPGWYYYDDMALIQGPFVEPYDCYEYAVNQLLAI